MNLIKFMEEFPDESSYRVKFKEYRDKEGIICRICGHTEHYWLNTIEKYECKKCKTRTSLRSGTVIYASNLPFRYWFVAMHLLTSTKKTFSALELQRQIGHKFMNQYGQCLITFALLWTSVTINTNWMM